MSLSLPAATDLASLLELEMVKPDTFLGASGVTGWGRIYGGQAVAQALRAASHTVAAEQRPHSLHAYFIREGDEHAPVLFEVDRVRDGRSFSTRQVVASQAQGPICTVMASFHRPEQEQDLQTERPPADVPRPDELDDDETPLFFRSRARRGRTGEALDAWMRATTGFGDDPVLNACALAYLSDEHLLGSALGGHPLLGDWEALLSASLDHAVWLHRPFRVDEWLLFVLRGHGMADARGVSTALVFREDGTHVATVAQEALGRVRRDR